MPSHCTKDLNLTYYAHDLVGVTNEVEMIMALSIQFFALKHKLIFKYFKVYFYPTCCLCVK